MVREMLAVTVHPGNKRWGFFIAVEATLLGGVGTVLFIIVFPWALLIGAGLASSNDPASPSRGMLKYVLLASCIGGLVAICEMWVLAIKTIAGYRYHFGLRFWCVILLAGMASVYLLFLTGVKFGLYLLGPIFALVIHLVFLQLKYRDKMRYEDDEPLELRFRG